MHSDEELKAEILRFSNAMKCIVKQSYATEPDATYQAERLQLALRKVNPLAAVRAYQCLSCDLWHVGRSPDAPNVKIRHCSPAERDMRREQQDVRRTNPRAFRRFEAGRRAEARY